MDVLTVGSCETSETDDDEHTSPDRGWQSVLGCSPTALLLDDFDIGGIDVYLLS